MTTLTKKSTSTLLISIFATFIVIGALISEFFQAPILSSKELNKLQFLFSKSDVESITQIKIKTTIDEFSLNKAEGNNWILSKPRVIDANLEIVNKILETLEDIKIKRIYPKDQINLANFSLDNPISTLTIKDKNDELKTLSFGLVNPIDNSTYLSVSGDNAIYHINVLKMSFEKIELSSIIDSQIFNFNWNQVKSIKIYPQRQTSAALAMERSADGTNWVSGSMALDEEKVGEYLNELISMKSHIILDKTDDELTAELDKILSVPFFKIVIETTKNETNTYEISYFVNTLPNVKIEKKQNFIIRASNRKHPFLVNKDFMKLFYKRSNQYKGTSIKKLIY
ncbi:DUF4340 domain-containing protein [Bacteriovorax sp. Seq25_V]|uniref:DUF4340 domain-containing protein n=1 Tax=Bacteriovorax sp. Seq25_V TaxID=1201288 RepID=UPI000389F113|nr:DUF4340 domain-containing protein [Bacteriovorax sp. Seq25_V]EQC46647.1 PF14238 domain protein [Bacteriovorax sp. Seq25_V]